MFCIDPQDAMTAALQGCESQSQLDMAYKILVKQLRIAQQTVMKYEVEYQGNEVPLSPVSTAPELYSDFDKVEGVDGRMRYILEKILHHQGHLTPEARRAVQEGVSWDVLHPTQALTWDEPSRRQMLIPQQTNNPGPVEAKKKVDWSDYSSPWPDNGLSVEQGCDNPHRIEPLFRFQTPFRSGRQFLEQPSDSNPIVFFSTPALNVNPDVTVGLATPSRTNLGDNIREESDRFPSRGNNNPGGGSGRLPPPHGGLPPHCRGGGGGSPPHSNHGGGGGSGGGGFSHSGNSNSGNESFPASSRPPGNRGPPPPGGGDNDPPGPGNAGWPQAPYGNMPASIKTELKVEQLLEWDGNHWMAIDYFWNVQQLACLGGWLPEALGYWLWFRLKEKSMVKTWFIMLPITHQSYM